MNMNMNMNMKIIIPVIFLAAAKAAFAACPADLVSLHAGYVAQYKSAMQTEALSGDSNTYYNTSYYLHGMLGAFECTRDETDLQLINSLIDTAIGKAQDYNGDGYSEWKPVDAYGRPIQLGSWQMMSAMARAAAVIMRDAGLKSKYGAQAQRWITFIHRDVVDRWYKGIYGEKIPYCEWNRTKTWSDKDTHFLTIMVHLYRATGNTYYRDVAVRGANIFKGRLKTNGTGWLWDWEGYLMGVDGNTAGVLTGALASPASAQFKYKTYFDQHWAGHQTWADSQAASGSANTYYGFQYVLMGMIGMYEGTGDLKYLDQALRWSETMVSKATLADDKGYRNWSAAGSFEPNGLYGTMLEELQGATEPARVARLILTNPNLSAYHARARAVRDFINVHMVEKWLYSRSQEAWFLWNASDKTNAYSDKTAMIIRIMLDLHKTGITKYAALTKTLADGFLSRTQAFTGGSLIWDYKNGWKDGYSMDTSHGNRYPIMAVDLMNSGVTMNRTHITGLARLLTEVIWNKSLSLPLFTNFIDGVNDSYSSTIGPYQIGVIFLGWAALGAYDTKAQQVIEAHMDAIIANPGDLRLTSTSTHGRFALPGFLTMNRAILGGTTSDTVAPLVTIISPASGTTVSRFASASP
jgi:hypothetical protein